jgi:hypothetical protein
MARKPPALTPPAFDTHVFSTVLSATGKEAA